MSDPTSSQSWNGHAYVANSPLSFTDPTGMVRAGSGCNVGVMCLDDGGGGFGEQATTHPVLTHQRVRLPVLRWTPAPSWGGPIIGDTGFGTFGVGAISPTTMSPSTFPSRPPPRTASISRPLARDRSPTLPETAMHADANDHTTSVS